MLSSSRKVEEYFGIVQNLGSIGDKQGDHSSFNNIVEFDGHNYTIFTTSNTEGDMIKLSKKMVENNLEIAKLVRDTQTDIYKIVELC